MKRKKFVSPVMAVTDASAMAAPPRNQAVAPSGHGKENNTESKSSNKVESRLLEGFAFQGATVTGKDEPIKKKRPVASSSSSSSSSSFISSSSWSRAGARSVKPRHISGGLERGLSSKAMGKGKILQSSFAAKSGASSSSSSDTARGPPPSPGDNGQFDLDSYGYGASLSPPKSAEHSFYDDVAAVDSSSNGSGHRGMDGVGTGFRGGGGDVMREPGARGSSRDKTAALFAEFAFRS